MGTRKTLVLALLVSTMMVLAFMIGSLPFHEAESIGAAADADGNGTMVALLDSILFKQGDEVTLESRMGIDGVVVKTPEDNADLDALVIPVPLQAGVTNDPAATVTYVANEEGAASAFVGDGWPAISGAWFGDDGAVSAEYSGPSYIGALDISSFLTGAASAQRTIAIYALVNAALDSKAAASYTYENANLGIGLYDGDIPSDGSGLNDCNDSAFTCVGKAGFGDAVKIDIFEVEGTVDGTDNGFPDSIFDDVDPGEIWVANIEIDGELRTVLVANLDDGGAKAAGSLLLNPTENVQVQAPDLEALQAEGLVAVGETALVIVEVVDDLAALLDSADLTDDGVANGSPADVPAWAAQVDGIAPGNLVTGASFIEVSILATSGSTYFEIDDLTGTGLEVTLTVDSLIFDDPDKAQLWSYPTVVDGSPVFITNEPGFQSWTRMADDSFAIAGSAFTASLETLSVFGMFDAGLELISADPDVLPEGLAYDVTLTGVIPVASALNMAQATAAYALYFNGVEAAFQDVADAISAYDGVNPNFLRVVAPALSGKADVDIEIRDAVNPANAFVGVALASTTPTATIAVSADVVAGSDPAYVPGATFAVTPESGSGLPTGTYFTNDAVSVTATYDITADTLEGWTFNGVDLGSVSATVPVTLSAGANALVGTFSEVTVIPDNWTLTVQEGVGGSVTVDPETPGRIYVDGSVVSLTAVPQSGNLFVNWTGDVGDVADVTAAMISVTMSADRTVTANFEPIVGDPQLSAILPNEAPIFGGVVAQLQGANLSDQLTITIGGVEVQGFRPAADGSSVEINVPASTDASQDPLVVVDVAVSNGTVTSTLPNAFTYKRHWVKDGVNLTADILDPAVDNTVEVTLGAPHNNFADLFVPQLDVPAGIDAVYVIAQNSQFQVVKQNTPALGTSLIGAGEAIPNTFDFSVHLYAADVAKNTPPAGSGSLGNASGLIDFGRPVDGSGTPIDSDPMTLTIPLNDSVDYGAVRTGLTFWGIASEFDYVTEVTTVSSPEVVEYQSMLLNTEVDPALTTDTPDADMPNMVQQGRLYSLNGFTLRQSAVLPQEVIEGIRLATTSGTANGDIAGGTALKIVSPLGGLAWVDRVELTEAAKAVGGTADESNFITVAGTDEYNFEFTTPKSADPGIVDLTIYLKSNSAPAVTLSRVFEYTRASKPIDNIILIGIGLLVAILGLLAGGSSGGGGGGPCFIASAAYGTPLAAEVDTLRSVRDSYMLNNTLGTAFVDSYYRVSPAIADVVAQSPVLAAIMRVLLVPVIFLGKVALAMPTLTAFVGLSLGFAYLRRRRAAGRA